MIAYNGLLIFIVALAPAIIAMMTLSLFAPLFFAALSGICFAIDLHERELHDG